jgi:hypothetical protein
MARIRAWADAAGMNARRLHLVEERIALPDGAVAQLREGALELRDPEGRLMVRYRDGVAEISAPDGDLRLAAPKGRVVVSGAEVCIEGEQRVSIAAPEVSTRADRIVEISRDALREVSELAEERIGRLKTFVKDAFSLTARRTKMRSEEETSIDGKRILLG